jgi:hypothetical protein
MPNPECRKEGAGAKPGALFTLKAENWQLKADS